MSICLTGDGHCSCQPSDETQPDATRWCRHPAVAKCQQEYEAKLKAQQPAPGGVEPMAWQYMHQGKWYNEGTAPCLLAKHDDGAGHFISTWRPLYAAPISEAEIKRRAYAECAEICAQFANELMSDTFSEASNAVDTCADKIKAKAKADKLDG